MTKAVSFPIGFLLLFTFYVTAPAQNAATGMAVNQAIMDQANTIVLRQKLAEARVAAGRDDLKTAAQLYEDAYALTQKIGSGIGTEKSQTISGLVAIRLELAKRYQKDGDYLDADTQVKRALKVAPHNSEALAFKKNNDAILVSMKGKMPDTATLEKVPLIQSQKTDAATHVQNGKLLYEAGKFEEAEDQLDQALKLDPDNQAAYYYLNLLKQANYGRQEHKRATDAQDKMVQVEKQWTPKVGIGLPVPNPYVTNKDVYTSPGRQAIYRKLNNIRLDNISWPDGLPLSEALRYLTDQSQKRDPDKKGINFNFNPNRAAATPATTGLNGNGNGPAPVQINPNTGQPEMAPAAASEIVDPSTINIKLNLTDVSLQDALNAMVLVADKPIQYSVEDWGVVFSEKPAGPEPPQLEMRVFKVDPNTFYQGLQSVSAFTFGSANNNESGNGSNGGGGGNSGGGANGQNGTIAGAVVPVVSMAAGGAQLRTSGNGNGGGIGAGGNNNGGILGGGAGGANGGNAGAQVFATGGGVSYLTVPGYMQNVSVAAQTFFKAIGVDLTTAGRSIAFNDRLGLLFVRATSSELDTIERAIQALNQVAPQVHIKARFIEISQNDSAALGFDWYLGQFNMSGGVVGQGGSAPSLYNGNPTTTGYFPGQTANNLISGLPTDQQITSGLRNAGPALATITGIMTDPNFRVVLHALQQRSGVETLAEPEVVTTSGRQTQMRATDIQYILTGYDFNQGNGGATVTSNNQ